MDREDQTSNLPQEFKEQVGTIDFDALIKVRPKNRKADKIKYLLLPKEKFDPNSGENIFDFLHRTWAPLYKRGEDITIHTLRRLDPAAYQAIPWPQTTFSEERKAGRVTDIVDFLRTHWIKLIAVGFVERAVLRARDFRAYDLVMRRVAPLPDDVRILSVSEHIDLQIKFAMEAGRPFTGRLAQVKTRIRKGERRFKPV